MIILMASDQRRQGLKSCFLLIVIAGIERFAFKGVASNFVTYLTDIVKMSNSSAAKTVSNWYGFTSMLPLLLASLADCCWDKYPTVLASSFLYLLGLVALTSTALSWSQSPASKRSCSFLYWSLCLISLGQGGFNPSLQAFGADQLETDDELPTSKSSCHKPVEKSLFFKWWYFGVCGGSLLGVTLMSYIQDTFGWVLGFAIPTTAMLTSIALFCCGSKIYAYKHDQNSDQKPFQNTALAIKQIVRKLGSCRVALSTDNSQVGELELQEKPLCPDNNSGSIKSLNNNTKRDGYLVENARVVLRLLPVWTVLLMFAVIFQQPATFFTKQGVTMERCIGSKFKIPPATLQSAITVSIILLMPFYDSVFIPITRLIIRNERGINVKQRIGVGMFLSILAMIIAAVVERKRLQISREKPHSETVPLSIFWLLPQYILLGISDIFTVVGMQEFFYSEVPVRMKTMGIALYTSVFGVGSFLSSLLISLVEVFTSSRGRQSWFSDDMTKARLDMYYWLLAFLSALSMLFYVILCRFYNSSSDVDNDNP